MNYSTINSLWDLSQAPSQFSQLPDDDFLALLQKQFPSSITESNGNDPNDRSVNPQSIQTQQIPLPGLTPPSDDSSPSPPSNNDPGSRRQSVYSRANDNEESALKRKASDDNMDPGPSSKNQHTCAYTKLLSHAQSLIRTCRCSRRIKCCEKGAAVKAKIDREPSGWSIAESGPPLVLIRFNTRMKRGF
jgi:AP-1-like factor